MIQNINQFATFSHQGTYKELFIDGITMGDTYVVWVVNIYRTMDPSRHCQHEHVIKDYMSRIPYFIKLYFDKSILLFVSQTTLKCQCAQPQIVFYQFGKVNIGQRYCGFTFKLLFSCLFIHDNLFGQGAQLCDLSVAAADLHLYTCTPYFSDFVQQHSILFCSSYM